jgi:uncharacterized protein (TIGR00288 family)
MLIFPRDRLGLLIDGPNLQVASRALGFGIDFKRLLELFRQQGDLRRALYYTTLAEAEGSSSVRPLIDWLDYNGYTTVAKLVKIRDVDGGQTKGNINVELAVDAMRLGNSIDHVILLSGSGDLKGLVTALQEQGKRVTVISTLATKTSMVADELRRQADQFVDLVDLQDQIGQSQTRASRFAR